MAVPFLLPASSPWLKPLWTSGLAGNIAAQDRNILLVTCPGKVLKNLCLLKQKLQSVCPNRLLQGVEVLWRGFWWSLASCLDRAEQDPISNKNIAADVGQKARVMPHLCVCGRRVLLLADLFEATSLLLVLLSKPFTFFSGNFLSFILREILHMIGLFNMGHERRQPRSSLQ